MVDDDYVYDSIAEGWKRFWFEVVGMGGFWRWLGFWFAFVLANAIVCAVFRAAPQPH